MTPRRSASSPAALAVACLLCGQLARPLAAQPSPDAATEPPSAHSHGPEASGAGEPPAAVRAEYRDVVARAIAEFGAGRWAEARSLFLRAHELWPSARTFRSLGMTSFELRAYGRALVELQASLDDPRRPLSAEPRAQVAALIEQTRAFVGRYRVTLAPPEAALWVDGAARALDPGGVILLGVGRHELLVRADGHQELRHVLEVQGNEDDELRLSLEPIAPAPGAVAASGQATLPAPATLEPRAHDARGPRLWTWVAGAAAVALGAGSAALWFHSQAEFDALAERCEREVCRRGMVDTSSVETAETAHHVTLGLAVIAGVSAVALYFVEGSQRPAAEPVVGLGVLGAHGRF